MEDHHRRAIEHFLAQHRDQSDTLGVLLGGSLAHGFATAHSDVDLMLVVTAPEYARRREAGKLTFATSEGCDWPGGYIDVKVVDGAALELTAQRGSDPARFAYQDAQVLFSRWSDLEALVARIPVFPWNDRVARRRRFAAQLLAWRWFHSEALAKANPYLTCLARQKLTLFASRLVLNEAARLYPYHKWLLRVVGQCPRPSQFLEDLEGLLAGWDQPRVADFCTRVLGFCGMVEADLDWPNVFLDDSEGTWREHESPIDDL